MRNTCARWRWTIGPCSSTWILRRRCARSRAGSEQSRTTTTGEASGWGGAAGNRGPALNDLYQDAIIAAARRTTGRGRLAQPHGSATVDNPLCGDRVSFDVVLGTCGRVALVGHVVRGCLLCEAAAVLIAENAPQRRIGDLLRAGAAVDSALKDGEPFPWPELEMFAPVRGVKSRHRCVTLAFETIAAAIAACDDDDSR